MTVIALGLFVYISGYLIGSKDFDLSKTGVIDFYMTRILRIYPPFISAIVLFYVLKLSTGIALAKSAFLVSMFLPPTPFTLWFVTMIFVYYVAAPLLIYIIKRYGIGQYISFCIITMALCFVFRHAIDIRMAMYAPSFAAGVLMAKRMDFIYKINLGVAAIILILSFMISLNIISSVEQNLLSTPLALSGPLFLFVLFKRIDNRVVMHWSLPWITRLSYAGFFMYLFHRPIYKIFRYLYFPASGAHQVLYLLLVCLPVIIVMSWLGQTVYDQLISQLRIRVDRARKEPRSYPVVEQVRES